MPCMIRLFTEQRVPPNYLLKSILATYLTMCNVRSEQSGALSNNINQHQESKTDLRIRDSKGKSNNITDKLYLS